MNKLDLKKPPINKNKVKKETSIISIENIHKQKECYFENLQGVVLKNKKSQLESCIDKNSLKAQTLQNEINDITQRKEENEYLLNTMGILKEYYSLIDSREKPKIVFGKNVLNEHENELLNKYLDIIGHTKEEPIKKDLLTCTNCNKFDTIIQTKEMNVCSECGVEAGKILNMQIPYNDKENRNFLDYDVEYKRINYFKEILFQFQGKEQVNIPQNVLDKIITEISKEKNNDLSKITITKMKHILKKTGNSKWYEHTPYILNQINGKPIIQIDVETQQKLLYMFKIIQTEFNNHKFRSNFFSYPYIIHKMFELLGKEEYYEYFPYLSDRENKLHYQDTMWKEVVNNIKNKKNAHNKYLIDWRFIKST
jgi:Poxvirus Late Transcription Factor VLTF3 like